VPVAGASGAVAGGMGAYLLMCPRARVDVALYYIVGLRAVALPAWLLLGLWLALQVWGGLASPASGGIAFWAHVGGFSAGALLILLMRWRDVPLFQPLAPAPTGGFFSFARFLPDFTTQAPGSSSLWFWVKAAGFFILVATLVETFLL